MSQRNIKFSLSSVSLLFMLIWLGSYYFGQKDTGRVFGTLGLFLLSISHLFSNNHKWVRYLLLIIQLATTGIIFICAQKYYST